MIGNKDFNKMLNEALKQLEKKTNADRIRAMTDEELADWIGDHIDCSVCRKEIFEVLECPGSSVCHNAWLEWLKQEVEI